MEGETPYNIRLPLTRSSSLSSRSSSLSSPRLPSAGLSTSNTVRPGLPPLSRTSTSRLAPLTPLDNRLSRSSSYSTRPPLDLGSLRQSLPDLDLEPLPSRRPFVSPRPSIATGRTATGLPLSTSRGGLIRYSSTSSSSSGSEPRPFGSRDTLLGPRPTGLSSHSRSRSLALRPATYGTPSLSSPTYREHSAYGTGGITRPRKLSLASGPSGGYRSLGLGLDSAPATGRLRSSSFSGSPGIPRGLTHPTYQSSVVSSSSSNLLPTTRPLWVLVFPGVRTQVRGTNIEREIFHWELAVPNLDNQNIYKVMGVTGSVGNGFQHILRRNYDPLYSNAVLWQRSRRIGSINSALIDDVPGRRTFVGDNIQAIDELERAVFRVPAPGRSAQIVRGRGVVDTPSMDGYRQDCQYWVRLVVRALIAAGRFGLSPEAERELDRIPTKEEFTIDDYQ